jgi:hypothetical protein
MTPSKVKKVLTISFLTFRVLSIGSGLSQAHHSEGLPRSKTHREHGGEGRDLLLAVLRAEISRSC